MVGGGNTRCKTTKFDITLILHVKSIRDLGEETSLHPRIAIKLVIVNIFEGWENHGNILTILLVIFR